MNPLKSRTISLALIFSLLAPGTAPIFAADGEGKDLSVNEYRKPLSDEDIAKIAKALYDFAWADYVSDGYKKVSGADKNFQDAVTAWVNEQNKKPETIGLLADLHTVIAMKYPAQMAVLQTNMAPWTGKAEAAAQDPQAGPRGPLAGGKSQEWLVSFFSEAETNAHAILNAPPKAVTAGSVGQNEERPGGGVLGGTTLGQAGDNSGLSPFDRRGLYERGGIVQNVYQDGDKDADGNAHSRTIAMKIYTRKDADGTPIDEIAVYDLTNPVDIVFRHFPIDYKGGSATFQIDDRPGQDAPSYTLTMTPDNKGDMNISFARPKGKAGQGIGTDKDQPLTLGDLFKARAQQAVNEGTPVNIDGKDYLIIGQGGNMGAHLYFPADIKDRIDTGAPNELSPEGLAFINKRSNNRNMSFTNHPDLGMINGKARHLELQPGDSDHPQPYWKPVDGAGDPPPAPPAPAGSGSGGGTGGGTTSGGGTKDSNGGDNGPIPKEVTLKKTGATYAYDPDSTPGASPSKVRIYRLTPKGQESIKNELDPYAQQYVMVVGGKMTSLVPFYHKEDAAFEPKLVTTILNGKYLMTVSDQGVLYYSVDGITEKGMLPEAGRIDSDGRITGVKGKELLAQAMSQTEFSDQDIKTAMDNLDTLKLTKPFEVSGSRATNSLVVNMGGGHTSQFWPTVDAGPADDGSHKETKKGLAFDVSAGPSQDMPSSMEFQGEKLSLVDISVVNKSTEAILYVNDVEEGKGTKKKPRKWYFMFAFTNSANKGDRKVSLASVVFGQGKGSGYHDFPAVKPQIAGLMDNQTPNDPVEIRLVSPKATTTAKGVWAAFATAVDDPASKTANCLGPLIWWGMDKAEAMKACTNGAL